MNDILRTRLHDFTLAARAVLSEEAHALLAGAFGVRANGTLEPARDLPALQASPEAQETRQRIEQYLRDEIAAGFSGAEAVSRLAREVAFTHTNRLVAFKLLEARKLVHGTLDKHHASNGFLRYLGAHDEDLQRYEAGDLPRNALGEGPRDVAYRHFLLWQCGQLARELRVLFDPDALPSRLFPRPLALKEVIDALNDAALREAWQPGNEETLGWVYQSFNAKELEAAFRDVRLTGKKFEKQDIPAVTQLFTPRWIVQWLVHNTLGALWLEMHPDSRLREMLSYAVPAPNPHPGPLPRGEGVVRLARAITLLDPACGTMHFGLVAFDVLVEMYREETARAGEPGWPAAPSVASEAEIAASIIAHNLHGIDIDLRAVQLAALALFVKAKTLNPRAQLTVSNLACADVALLNGARLDAFLAEAKFTRPVYERLIRALWPRLKDAGQLGSLLRVEGEIRELIAREQRRQATDAPLLNMAQYSDALEGPEDFWEVLDAQIVQAFDAFARQHAQAGSDEGFFAGEAVKGFRLLDVLLRRYDVVVTNPPYLSQRKINAEFKSFLADEYPAGKLDTYAAFIQRCLELTKDYGRMGMLTMHSFMFISSYENLRRLIRNSALIDNVLHLGPRLFDVGNPGTLQTVAFTLTNSDDYISNDAEATYFRLVKAPIAEAKRMAFEQALAQLRAQGSERFEDPRSEVKRTERSDPSGVYTYRQADFDAIPGSPWVYWVTPALRQLFIDCTKLGDIAPPRVGLQTGVNERFLRFWWEVGLTRISRDCINSDEAKAIGHMWFSYMKGGNYLRWYGNQEYVVNWMDDGQEIRNLDIESGRVASRPQNADFYFRRGVTYSYLTQGTFSARLSPGGFIFDVAGSSLFPDDVNLVLAILNSKFAAFALNLINPTVNFQVGDLARLPIPATSSARLNVLVEQAIALAREDSAENETTYDFVAPPAWPHGLDDVAARHAQLAGIEREIDDEVYRLYGIGAADRAAIEAELAATTGEEGGERETENAGDDDDPTPNPSLRGRGKHAVQGAGDKTALAQAWVSYAVGVVLGRFRPVPPTHPQPLPEREGLGVG